MFQTAVTGDTHGDFNRFGPTRFPRGENLDREDVVIILGDFGLPWPPKGEKANQDLFAWLAERPWTTLVVDGNHDNHPYFKGLPTIEKFGNTVGVFCDGVYWLKRGHVYTIQDRTFFVMGGAYSIDQYERVEGISYWPDEIPNFAEWDKAAEELDRVGWKVDFVVTHEAPLRVVEALHPTFEMWNENKLVPRPLQRIADMLDFKHWYFGHHHFERDLTVDGKNYTCLYETIRFI